MSASRLNEFSGLILEVQKKASPGWGEPELGPWLRQRAKIVRELRQVGGPDSHRQRLRSGDSVLYGLYALSRLVDILIGPHQPVNDDPALLAWTTGTQWWSGPAASPSAWAAFLAALGATVITEERFHPFFHEIVAVEPADDPDEPPTLVAEHWPGALVGGLLLTRAGVSVRAGVNAMDPEVAARSCLYWAWWRRNRVVRDLSHGWGHNSQWATEFRRDYLVGEELHYNVDQAGPLPEHAAELPEADRRDLLRFRHSVRTDLGDDRWPYDETLIEPRKL